MSSDKPRTFGGGGPLADRNTTPKLAGQGRLLPRLSGSAGMNSRSAVAAPCRGLAVDLEGSEDGHGTPSPRRDDRPYSAGEIEATKENIATPVKSIIESNITPRSGSRKARVETASPRSFITPGGTPTTSRPVSSMGKRDRDATEPKTSNAFGVRSPPNGRSSRSESLISDGSGPTYASRPIHLERNTSAYSSSGTASPKGPAMFFHASDVQTTVSSKSSTEKPLPQPRALGWVNTAENGRTSAMSNNSIPNEHSSKFFYANDPAQSKSPPSRLPNGSTSNSRPPLQTIYSAQAPTSPQRAPSPLKEELTAPLPRKSSISKASPRRHTRLVSNGGSDIKAPEAVKTDLSRRSSLNSRTGARTSTSHVRSSSVQSAGRSPARRNSTIQLETSPIEGTKRASMIGVNGKLPHNNNNNPPPPSFASEYNGPLSPSLPQSPTKPQSKLDQMNELAAQARRERKVLDLEISNSSLLAINRTLEREMRKQNAELRRYRRLSRSGRLSFAPTSGSSKKSRLSETDTAIDSDDFLSASDSEDDDPDDVDSVKSSTSNTSDSATARAARSRFQDPERASLDLSAHRLLLLESQKMNQSIKRCLSHTDALIAAGRKALEHQAEAVEVENLGPKVLTADEYEDDSQIERGQGLLSPGLGGPRGSSINPWERSLVQIGGLDGGLETPDYLKWGSGAEPELLPYKPDDDYPAGTRIIEGAWVGSEERSSSPPLESSTPIESEPRKRNEDVNPLTLPGSDAQAEDVSFQASLDGLDSNPSNESSELPAPEIEPPAEYSRPPSPSRPPPTTNAAANTPGNRSSIQNFGTYLGLQSLSIFGQTSQ